VTLATFDEPLAARFAGEDGLVHWVRPR
jgi:hypothetical protein